MSRRRQVATDIRSVFDSHDRTRAEARLAEIVGKFRRTESRLAAWMESSLPEGLTIFQLPEHYRRRLRTSNGAESLTLRIKRRTRVAGLFPNEASVLRLVTAILMESSEEWETARA